MSPEPIEFVLKSRGIPIKTIPGCIYAYPGDTGEQVYERIAAASSFPINRLRLTKGCDGTLIPSNKDVTVAEIGISDQNEIFVKDLGPQIAWRTVFMVEYLGPLIIHPVVYYFRHKIYYGLTSQHTFPPPSDSISLSFVMIMIHFLKREFETLFVHRFSSATMPAFNIFKNSAHYWLLGGLNIALCTYCVSPSTQLSTPVPMYWHLVAIGLFVIGEFGNLSAHLTLRSLRSDGGVERNIPVTGVFSLVPVTCPNYFFETLAWTGILAANRSLSTGIFMLVAVVQMGLWAQKKETKYRKEFGSNYKKKSFVMLPGIF